MSGEKTPAEYEAIIDKLRKDNQDLRYDRIKWEVFLQFYSQLLAVPMSVDNDTRLKRQAKIIGDMQYRIRNQRAQLRRMQKSDPLAPTPHLARYNTYRHTNKLYNLWQEAMRRLKALGELE